VSLVFFDSNIIIDHLWGIPEATALVRKHATRSISAVVWMEVMVAATTELIQAQLRETLSWFNKIEIDTAIQERAIRARRDHRLKLLDAIIFATAQEHNAMLFTRDSKDFPPDPRVVVPYRV
jgi:predicted nucleic acid-binding protein